MFHIVGNFYSLTVFHLERFLKVQVSRDRVHDHVRDRGRLDVLVVVVVDALVAAVDVVEVVVDAAPDLDIVVAVAEVVVVDIAVVVDTEDYLVVVVDHGDYLVVVADIADFVAVNSIFVNKNVTHMPPNQTYIMLRIDSRSHPLGNSYSYKL